MTSDQVWSAVLDELAASGEIPAANLAAWLRPARIVGQERDGRLVLGAPHAPAQRRIASHFVLPIRAAMGRVLGVDVDVEIVVADRWLAALGESKPGRFAVPGEQAGG